MKQRGDPRPESVQDMLVRPELLDAMHLGVIVADAQHNILYANRSMAKMHGRAASDLVGQHLSIFVVGDEGECFAAGSRDTLHVRKDGTTFPVHTVCDAMDGAGAAVLVVTCEDVSQRRRAEHDPGEGAEDSRTAVIRDSLTGLLNRVMLVELVGRALSRAMRRDGYLFAVLVLDLDRFHVVNDSLGHAGGDQLLAAIAERLQPCFRTVDAFARLSGDEFGILLDDISDISDALRVANRIHDQLKGAFRIGDEDVFSSGRVGIALSTSGYDQPEDLLRDATVALHRVKATADATEQVFDMAMHQRATARLQLETDLRWAVERQEFRIYYQPIVDVPEARLTGLEALVRWEHPRRGLLRPIDFLTVAEETGIIVPLGWWVLEQACRHVQEWRQRFSMKTPPTLSVNVSGKQLLRRDAVSRVDQILRGAGLDPGTLRLEVTETVIMDDADETLRVLSQLRDLGVHLEIDDFGIGYSSLRYLHRFPIDTLKIDRSFVNRVHERQESAEIVRTILALAKNIGVRVVAEGVETAAQLEILREMGCERAQGNYFSEPVEHGRVADLLGEPDLAG